MADKTKTIKNASDKDLDEILVRLRKESECQYLIREIQRKSNPSDFAYGRDSEISTEVPIESLYHFGKVGMKWGRRKNRTPIERTKVRKFLGDMSPDAKKKSILKTKDVNKLSNADIKYLNERLQLEKTYSELNKKKVSKGKEFVGQVLGTSGKTVATALATAAGMYAVKKAIGKTMGKSVLDEMFPKK